MSTDQQAYAYAQKHASGSNERTRMYEAVVYGRTLNKLERKAIGDPLETAAFEYASRFTELTIEDRFKLHQAVIYGAKLPSSPPVEEEITDNSNMPFGKHKGKKMANVPAFYLLWLYNEGCSHAGVRKYIIDNLDSLQKEAGQKQRM